jgi:hypothetical protein
MSFPVVQNVLVDSVRTNLDGTALPERQKAYALSAQGGYAPESQSTATYHAGESICCIFNGQEEYALYMSTEDLFDEWQAFAPPISYGSPETDETLYQILFVRVPGASGIAGLCAANQ